MSNLIEELENGDCFESGGSIFVITCDFKSSGSRLAINLNNGNAKWFLPAEIVDKTSVFYFNKENHLIAIKEVKKDDIS